MQVGNITDDMIEQIKKENDLREVAKEYGLEIDGNGKACCPFHKDGKNGNLHFFQKKDEDPSYFCFSATCNAGRKWDDKEKKVPHMLRLPDGTEIEDGGPSVIGFVMNIERCSFVEACVILMERIGMPVPQKKINLKLENQKKKMHARNIQYAKNLIADKRMLAYLEERGIDRESIKKWRLGYIPESDSSNPLFGERVAGRLVFGLAEESYNAKQARTVAMAYRTMKDEKPKYLNDYTSELYEKRYYLYGINEARRTIKKEGYAIVMEGYTDVIISHQSGIENAIATCGTAFSKDQMEKLRKLTRNLYFWYDGDSAGYDAMIAALPTLLEMGFRVFIIDSSPYDPAELMNQLKQNTKAIKKFIVDNAKQALHVIAESIFDDFDNRVMKMKTEALDELLPYYNKITNESEKIVFKSMLNQRLHL